MWVTVSNFLESAKGFWHLLKCRWNDGNRQTYKRVFEDHIIIMRIWLSRSFILVHKITWNVAKTHLFFIFSFVLKDNNYFLKNPIFGLTRIISYYILTFDVLEKTLINICIGFVLSCKTISDMPCQSPNKTCQSSDNTCHSSWISEYPKTIDQWNRVAEKLRPPLIITRAKPN